MDMIKLFEIQVLATNPVIDKIPEGVRLIGAPEFWVKGRYGEGIKIAVIDTGCDINHKDLKDRIIGVRNFTTEGSINDVTDNVGHGTHVAGIISANGNDSGITGVAPKANLLILKALTKVGGSYVAIINAINYAIAQNVDIISMSLGGKGDIKELHQAIINAINKNIVVVSSAGNDGDARADTIEINYPAAYNESICVGSVSCDKNISRFSASNKEVDLLAPGQGSNGRGILSLSPGNRYIELAGTSMSAPHVAGAIALLKNYCKDQFGRTLTETELYAQLIKRTKSLGFPKIIEGNGILDLRIE